MASDILHQVEIIVVDNNSSDGSRDYFEGKFPTVSFIWNSENVGFAKANNQAIRICNGDYILLLNPDTVVGEHVLSRVVSFMDSHPNAGAAGVKMINGGGIFLPESKRGFPSPWTSFCKIFGLSKLFPRSQMFGKYHLIYLNENEIHEVDILCGAFMMIRSDVLDKIGLLDESFFMYGEDIDLSYRIALAGYKNYYIPEKIIHYKGESTRKDTMRYVKIFYYAMYIFFQKHYPRSGFFYSMLVPLGIFTRASISGLKRVLLPITSIISKKESIRELYFDAGDLSYEKIIDMIEQNKDKSMQSVIYSPNSGMAVSSVSYVKKDYQHVVGE
jgi:GT2 family glycosyltransferase